MATHFNRPLAGVAYDWSKCYDRLPLGLLEELVEKIGMPAALKGPMLAAYAAPRRVLYMGLASEEVHPTCGLTPGCPAATDWLALLMLPWLLRVRRLNETKARAYVDDLTAWATGHDCVEVTQLIVKLTADFERATSLVLHEGKSRRFANGPDLRRRLLEAGEGPRVDSWFKDLGVIQNVGKKRTKGPGRLTGAIARVKRVAQLAVPLHKKGLRGHGLGHLGGGLWTGIQFNP